MFLAYIIPFSLLLHTHLAQVETALSSPAPSSTSQPGNLHLGISKASYQRVVLFHLRNSPSFLMRRPIFLLEQRICYLICGLLQNGHFPVGWFHTQHTTKGVWSTILKYHQLIIQGTKSHWLRSKNIRVFSKGMLLLTYLGYILGLST